MEISRPDINILASYPKLKKNEVFMSISYRDMKNFSSASDLKFLCSVFSRDTVAFFTYEPDFCDYL